MAEDASLVPWCPRVLSHLIPIRKNSRAGTNWLWHAPEEKLIMSPTCPEANDKETFLLLLGDGIGKSLLLLACTHTHAHTGIPCAKLFEELVVLLLNELWMFPESPNARQWQHIAEECLRDLGWSDNCLVRQKQKQLTEIRGRGFEGCFQKIFNF